MIKILSSLLIFLTFIVSGYSQRLEHFSVAATSEAVGFPFTNYLPYHPGIEIKGCLKKVDKSKSYRYLNANLGFFYHKRVETAFYLGGEYQYTHKLFNENVGLDIPIGLGYMHTFYPGEVYVQTDEGDFEKKTQFGRPHFYLNLGIGVSYIGDSRIQPFIRQELFVETFFANGLPVIPHSLLKIGVHIKLGNNESE